MSKKRKETFYEYLEDAFTMVAMCFLGWAFMYVLYALGFH